MPVCLLLCAACGGASEPKAPSAASQRFVVPPETLPDAQALEGAPECVLAMAKTRQCFADHMSGAKPTTNGQFSCPEYEAWQRSDLRLDAITSTLPHGLSHAWNKPLACSLQFNQPLGAADLVALERLGVKLASGYGPIEKLAIGTIQMSHLYCAAEFELLAQLNCEQPSPQITASRT